MAGLESLLEALLLAADRPLAAADVADLVNLAVDEGDWDDRVTPESITSLLVSMAGAFSRNGGVELLEVGGGWRLRTVPALANMIRRLWPDRAARLSGAALEVLSVVAYRQPCTRVELEEVRGVDCGGVLRHLLERRLVRIMGKKDEPGRPLLYGTTPEFLETFSLPNLRSLPTLRDLESLRAEAAAAAQASSPSAASPSLPSAEPAESASPTSEPAPPSDAPEPELSND